MNTDKSTRIKNMIQTTVATMILLITANSIFTTSVSAGNVEKKIKLNDGKYAIFKQDNNLLKVPTYIDHNDETLERTESYLYDNRTYSPIGVFRDIKIVSDSSPQRADVEWDEINQTVTVKFKFKEVTSWSDNIQGLIITKIDTKEHTTTTEFYMNGVMIERDIVECTILNINNKIYLPLHIFRDIVGLDLVWDSNAKTVTIYGTLTISDDLMEETKETLQLWGIEDADLLDLEYSTDD